MSKKSLAIRKKPELEEEDYTEEVSKEALKPQISTPSAATSITIPEFLVEEPYPYFYHTWNKLLLCDLNDAEEVFHIRNDKDLVENIYIHNKLTLDYETQHKKYGNSLQNYYKVIPQTGTINVNEWKEEERINVNNITPVL